MKNKQEKGITLIALVVTIVVLLILAGVSISLVLNNNGVISKAKDAKNQYAEAQTNEEKQLNEVADWISTKVGETTGGGNSNYNPADDGVPIPEGFYYVGGTKDSGLVISDNSADKEKYKGQTTVGTELQGNQFVWIPVENIADYKRTAYGESVDTGIIDTSTNSTKISYNSSPSSYYYTEAMPSDEKTSVEQNKGYYIGRYEAGDKESTEAKTLRSSGASTSNTITIKANQAPYNYVTRDQAKTLAEGFGTKQNYKNVKTKLVSSYAWDTAIAFIQKTVSNYGSSSPQGNYSDTTFDYTDITTGASKTKAKNRGTLVPTGQTTGVCNIYDMGGNVTEWTTESHSRPRDYPYTPRGSKYNDSFAASAGDRSYSSSYYAYGNIGFRATLFL